MKNQKLLFILVPLTLFLWGLIIFRIMDQKKNPNNVNFVHDKRTADLSQQQPEDTFNLIANYRDPFLERSRITNSSYPENLNVRLDEPPKEKTRENIAWPSIRYIGIIYNENANNYLYLIEIDQVTHLLRKEDHVGSIKMKKVFRDSITIQFKNQLKTFRKD